MPQGSSSGTANHASARPFRTLITVLLAVYVPVLALLAATLAFASRKQVQIGDFFRDATAVGGLPVFVGALSRVGGFLWAATAATCLLTAAVAAHGKSRHGETAFFLEAGLLSMLLMADDAFLFHEAIGPLHFGLASEAIVGTYALLTLAFLAFNHRRIRRTNHALLLLALACLAASVGIDLLSERVASAAWLAYLPLPEILPGKL